MTATPARLFKYEPPSLQCLRNLKTQTLFFGSPRRFNDPYDCALVPRVRAPTSEQVAKFRLQAIADRRLSPKGQEEMAALADDELAAMLLRSATDVATRSVEGFLNTKGVTCFSESNENLLMWSHYADRGQGVCLEFDTSYSPFEKIMKVEYSEFIPEIDLTAALLENNFDEILRLYCTKSLHWSYEREWRGIHKVANTPFTYEAQCLRAIYFGTEVAPEIVEIICLILQGQSEHVRFFKAERSKRAYSLIFSEFTYTSFLKSNLSK